MLLYHGSNQEIMEIDLERCRPNKDFGKGFYLTSIKTQAVKMAGNTVRLYGGSPVVTVYEIDDRVFHEGRLSIRIFPARPTIEWAQFIFNNRRLEDFDIQSPDCNKDNKYDIVIGPVADDRIAATIRRYMDDELDVEGLARKLTYRELSNQYSFHTPEAIAYLKKAGVLDE